MGKKSQHANKTQWNQTRHNETRKPALCKLLFKCPAYQTQDFQFPYLCNLQDQNQRFLAHSDHIASQQRLAYTDTLLPAKCTEHWQTLWGHTGNLKYKLHPLLQLSNNNKEMISFSRMKDYDIKEKLINIDV
jgi:hypothetical protein